MGFLGGTSGEESAHQCRGHKRTSGFDPWVRKILWSRKWKPSQVFLPGKSRSLAGYSPWSHKEWDMTERACVYAHTHTHTHSHTHTHTLSLSLSLSAVCYHSIILICNYWVVVCLLSQVLSSLRQEFCLFICDLEDLA